MITINEGKNSNGPRKEPPKTHSSTFARRDLCLVNTTIYFQSVEKLNNIFSMLSRILY